MRRLAYLVACSAPPSAAISELVELLQSEDWAVRLIPTEAAYQWFDASSLEALTGLPVGVDLRTPGEPKTQLKPDLVVVAPATFNTINKWANGVNDSPVLGILNEVLGSGTPVIVSPYAKASLTAHPAFGRSLKILADCGVLLTDTEALRPASDAEPYDWSAVLALLPRSA